MLALINLELFDYTYSVTESVLWSILESELYITSANMLECRYFFTTYVFTGTRKNARPTSEKRSGPESFSTQNGPSGSNHSRSTQADTFVDADDEEAILEMGSFARNSKSVDKNASALNQIDSVTSDLST
jgi:hypothetical protein